ncbi:nitrate reductase delta subunit [Caldalkalibacillus uzonensis]|uniref:Nitrate reductase delta subunit n=1 Tax=Caldalkalibacillus uzonensis TaxID=353224 RepID=A0ABU0CU94_9BACI|nr:nitrate reductase molybdenum cofactor assembly chaperone [Caldalkalibacillus uzonensis]MDQ0339090.1 nitrate reductase delta subunit [Caldalkalibacillus uzonensis]
MNQHQKIFKLASLFLQYPDKEWVDNGDLEQEVSCLENQLVRECYLQFLKYVQHTPLEKLCETYVQTFDFSDKTTLYLTYNIFGDNRERGQAFLKLKEEFANAGFPLEDDELPDYLPLVLEFASIARTEHSQRIFMIHKKGIDKLLAGLEEDNNPYQWVLRGCIRGIDSLLKKTKAS